MKQTVIQIGHEVAQEYGLTCCICGGQYNELHHAPKRHKRGGAPEILCCTLWPICKKCHMADPVLEEIVSHVNSDLHKRIDYYECSIEHIRRCYARGCYNEC